MASGGLKNQIHAGWITAHVGIGFDGDNARFPTIGHLKLQRVWHKSFFF